MGCGNSKRSEPPSQRRIRISEANTHAIQQDEATAASKPTAPQSTVVAVGKSFQDGVMMEQESFVKSLPSESRHILNATMANMLDLGQASPSPADYVEREHLYQSMRDEMPMARPALQTLPEPSFGNVRKANPDELQLMAEIANKLSDAFKTIQVVSSTSVVAPFLPIPQ